MSTILDLPEVHPRVARYTVEEYERLAELGLVSKRAELIRGLVIEKRSKSPLHCSLAEALFAFLTRAVPVDWVVFQERPLRLADSEPEPDLAVVRGRREDFKERHPTSAALVIEVAVSSAELDRANAGLYAEAGVQEYWIVLGREWRVEVFRRPAQGGFKEHFSSNEASG